MKRWRLLRGDCLERLAELEDESVDSVVTDPPAGIGFMGKSWDKDKGGGKHWRKWLRTVMKECMRAMRPGAHGLVWALPRTSHWTAMALETAGFEIRDVITHHYGCLSEDTEMLVDGRWEPYQRAVEGRLALCYDVRTDDYSWQPIQKLHIYDYANTAFRLLSDHVDEIVSIGHRCIVERDGGFVFQEATTLEQKVRVPFLESVQGLLGDLPVPHARAGAQEPVVLEEVCEQAPIREAEEAQAKANVPEMRNEVRTEKQSTQQGQVLYHTLRSKISCLATRLQEALEENLSSWKEWVDGSKPSELLSQDVRREESGLERWGNHLQEARQLLRSSVRAVSEIVFGDGSQGWVCDGAPFGGGQSVEALSASSRDRSSSQSQAYAESCVESRAVQEQPRSQTFRTSRYTKTDLVRV